MTWGLAVLLVIIFILFSVLLFLQFPDFTNFAEIYFIIVVIILFVILIFAIDFNNPITTTIVLKGTTSDNTLTYKVPYNDDTSFANVMNLNFAGVVDNQNNLNTQQNSVTFNYDAMDLVTPVTLNLADSGATVSLLKLPDYQIQVTINPNGHTLNGYLVLSLLCTGSQNINSGFDQI